MFANYAKQALKLNLSNRVIIVALILIPLVFGTLYGMLYSGMIKGYEDIKIDSPLVNNPLLSEKLILVAPAPALTPIGVMQINIFAGSTFFTTAFAAIRFIKSREKKVIKRLVAMGYVDGQVFWAEAMGTFLMNIIVCGVFNGLFLVVSAYLNHVPKTFVHLLSDPFSSEALSHWGALTIMVLLQAAFASGYTMMGMGLFRSERTFSQLHVLPAFVMMFLGGALFPVDAGTSGGIYEWMPNYILSLFYKTIYTGQWQWQAQNFLLLAALGLASVMLLLIGRWRFRLCDE